METAGNTVNEIVPAPEANLGTPHFEDVFGIKLRASAEVFERVEIQREAEIVRLVAAQDQLAVVCLATEVG